MPFRFRLKPLMRHRKFKLQEAQSALAIAETLRREIQARIYRAEDKIRTESELCESEQKQGMEASRYLHFKNYIEFLERELLKLNVELEKAAQEAEQCKQYVMECHMAFKVLENMESTAEESYKLLQARKDQKRLDEVAVLKDYRDRSSV